MERLQFIFTILLQQHRNKAPLKHYQFTEKFNYTDLQDRPTFTVKYLICRNYFKLAFRYLAKACFAATMVKMHAFVALVRILNFSQKIRLFSSSVVVATLCQSSAHFAKLTCSQSPRQRPRVFVFAYSCSMSVVKNKNIEHANISLLRVTAQDVVLTMKRSLPSVYRILIFCLPQYGNTKWLLDIQNTSTLTDDKLKIKFSSLKLTRPPDEFVSFDTRPRDFIVVSDDLTTANMNPCYTILLLLLS